MALLISARQTERDHVGARSDESEAGSFSVASAQRSVLNPLSSRGARIESLAWLNEEWICTGPRASGWREAPRPVDGNQRSDTLRERESWAHLMMTELVQQSFNEKGADASGC